MGSIIKIGQRLTFAMMAVLVVGATLLPAIASAQTAVSNRSIQLSSSSALAQNVHYAVTFTPTTSVGAFAVYFCQNSPLIGQDCDAPLGFNASSATSTTENFTDVTGSTNRVVVAGAITQPNPVTVDISGITNPSSTGQFYARIITFATEQNAIDSTATVLGSGARDQGSVALSINPTIGVSGSVLETLTFCVSGTAITANCGTTTTPVLALGDEVTADVIALTPGTISTGDLHTQITTNAVSGAVIRLKSNAIGCGGLIRAGAPSACDIAPALDTGIDEEANEAKFGVKTSEATPTAGVTYANGTFQPASGSIYNGLTYALNYVVNDQTGITSTYGDPFLDTSNAPANNQNMILTFGVSASNTTPAGSYSADLNLIATGRF